MLCLACTASHKKKPLPSEREEVEGWLHGTKDREREEEDEERKALLDDKEEDEHQMVMA